MRRGELRFRPAAAALEERSGRQAKRLLLAAVGWLAGTALAVAWPSDPGSAGAAVALPGAPPPSPELARRLEAALATQGPRYRPRTEHLDEQGRPRYVNRLILESSPYLLQHAHNPVDWYPWGDEAFERARALDRPVFLSVGYATCHWCHVMERESFEDEEIARFLNQHYVSVKVDREERPDVDNLYMTAVQIMTGQGGWPMSVWLTPDRQPFYGGSYFPARDGDRGARYGFLTLLAALERAWRSERRGLVERSAQLVEMVEHSLAGSTRPPQGLPAPGLVGAAAAAYRKSFDAVHGGLAPPPKFPADLSIRLLLRAHRRTGERAYLDMARLTLEKMAAGGLFDQVGGGFHRYSTDAEWLVPHFEKMLYDNALLAIAFLEGYQATGGADLADVARRVLDYVRAEMTAPEGGFYSATDADSASLQGASPEAASPEAASPQGASPQGPGPGETSGEGLFFTWTPNEIEAALGARDARAVELYYGVSEQGNFEGRRSILHRTRSLEAAAGELGVTPEELEQILRRSRSRLYEARGLRPPPLLDDKVIAAWNGLMISAFATGAQVLGETSWTETAERAAGFVLDRMRPGGTLRRTWRGGEPGPGAFLDDHAFLIAGLIDLYQAAADPRWLREAIELQADLDARFWDEAAGGYFLASAGGEPLPAREKPAWDGATPSGNSVALLNLLRLAELTTDDAYRRRADELLSALAGLAADHPTAVAELLVGLDFRHGRPKEIVLVTPGDVSLARPFLDLLHTRFVPNKVVVTTAAADLESLSGLVPFVEGKVARDGRTTAYVCQNHVCHLPTTELATFATLLED